MPPRSLRALALVALGLAAATARLGAHELYIRPSSFRPAAGERVALALEVGHAFTGSPVERRPGHLRRFVWLGAGGEPNDVHGIDGALPAGWLTGVDAGVVTVSYESEVMRHELPAARFASYLREEGLEHVLDLRRERGEQAEPGRELFSRCAKTVLEVGAARRTAAVGDATSRELPVVGCPLELVPDDRLLEPGSGVAVRVLWEGRPLAGVLVRATRAGDREPSAAARSDAQGLVRVELGAGAWLVHAVHMTPVTEPSAAPAGDWRSVWASLTFERPSG
jgi:uncharacterized GH25 family protein